MEKRRNALITHQRQQGLSSPVRARIPALETLLKLFSALLLWVSRGLNRCASLVTDFESVDLKGAESGHVHGISVGLTTAGVCITLQCFSVTDRPTHAGGAQTEMHEGYVGVRAKTGLSERPCRVLPRTVVEADSLGTESRRWQSILLWKNVIV